LIFQFCAHFSCDQREGGKEQRPAMESHESIKNAAIQLKVFNETTNILIFIGAGRTRTHPKKKNEGIRKTTLK